MEKNEKVQPGIVQKECIVFQNEKNVKQNSANEVKKFHNEMGALKVKKTYVLLLILSIVYQRAEEYIIVTTSTLGRA